MWCWWSSATSAGAAPRRARRLLQYEIDTPLLELGPNGYGAADAAMAYRACAQALDALAGLAAQLGDGLRARRQLYFASRRWHAGAMREDALRAGIGLQVEWLERAALREHFSGSARRARS